MSAVLQLLMACFKTTPSAPTLVSSTITGGGTTLTDVYSASVSNGAGGSGGKTLSSFSGGAVTATYSSGSGSTTLVYSLSRTVVNTETGGTTAYTQPGNGIEATTGGADVASYSGVAVANGPITFNFTQADGTLLSAIDARFGGSVSLFKTASGTLIPTAAFGGGVFYFSNSQPAAQGAQMLCKAFTGAGGEIVGIALQKSGSQVGFSVELRQDGDVDVNRNGTFVTRLTGIGAFTTDTTLKAVYNGTTSIAVSLNGTSIGSATVTALTGGFPGCSLASGSSSTAPAIDNWADLS